MVQNCNTCKKFAKLVSRPRTTIPISSTFNKVGTLDFGLKHVLWIIDRFSRFVQGKVIQNKRAETIAKAVTDI